MFNSLEEVKTRWQERFQETGQDHDHLPSPGYSDAEITALEEGLEMRIHASYRQILRDVILHKIELGSIRFWNPEDMNLDYHSDVSGSYRKRYGLTEGFLIIGTLEHHRLVTDNTSGAVYVLEFGYEFDTKELVAENVEQFICIAASITDYQRPQLKDRYQMVGVPESYLDQLGVEHGKEFWANFAHGVY